MRSHLTVALSLLILPATALAVRPPETTTLGQQPIIVRDFEPGLQRVYESSVAWLGFTEEEGEGWQARFDPYTGVPQRMWGPGLDLGAVGSEAEVGAAVMAFVQRHGELFGVTGAELDSASANYLASADAWYVDVGVARQGLPIWRGGLTFRFKQGLLVMAGAETWPEAPITGALELTEREAIAAAILGGRAQGADHTDTHATPMLLPIVRSGKARLRVVYEVRSQTTEPLGHWVSFVDAATGDLHSVRNDIRFFTGELHAEHDVRLGDGDLEISPMRYARVIDGGDRVFTGEDAFYEIDDAESYEVSLRGSRVRIIDDDGPIVAALPADPYTVLTAADFDGSQAGLTTFVYTQVAQDWARALAPEVGWSDTLVTATVNIDATCNAYFDGTINFFRSGDGCNNTGRLADVIFHEWGHGFHGDSILSGFYDGSVGEGAADTMSFLMTDDARIAPNFFSGGGGALRNVDNNARYPDDFESNEAYIHFNGLIFGGSMWDTREALREAYGEPTASEILGGLFAGILKGGPTMETAYDEAVFTDDNDADLSNGTPHLCQLVEGFGKHGLGPGGGQGVEPKHDPIESDEGTGGVPLELSMDNPAPECLEVAPDRAVLHYRIDKASWVQQPLDVVGANIEGQIPEVRPGDFIEYWIEVIDTNGSRYAEPTGGQIRPHTFYVGDVIEVTVEDFEDGEAGYTHALMAGEESDGADDWQLGTPIGWGGDPMGCYSGDACWGNDLGGGNFNGEYQNEKENALVSAAYDTAHYQGVFLSYRRWLTVEDGLFDTAAIFADDKQIWSNWASGRNDGSAHHLDDAWALHVVDLEGLADDGEVTLEWRISSDQGLSFGGWNIDDVALLAPATPDNRLGISDLVVTRFTDGGAAALSWTMPAHEPLAEVVVVRKIGSFPTGPTDGDVIWRAASPAAGTAVAIPDPWAVGKGNIYYAVYAGDGDNWLSWTREGLNAAALDATAGGCACDASGAGGAGGWLALGLLGLLRRRRR